MEKKSSEKRIITAVMAALLALALVCTAPAPVQSAPGSADPSADGSSPASAYAASKHPVTDLKAYSSTFRQIKLKWRCADYSGRYTIYRILKSGSLKKIGTCRKRAYTVHGLTPGRTYRFKVKSDKLSKAVSKKVITVKTAKIRRITTSSGKRWDIRIQAGQRLYRYDTIQGACSHGKYAYMALYNRNAERIKIAKVDLSKMKVVKVSGAITGHCHANTLTYNTRTRLLAAVCGKKDKKRVFFISARTLKKTGSRVFSIPDSFVHTDYKGVGGLAYNPQKNRYILKIYGPTNRIVRYTRDFRSKTYVPISKNRSYLLPQGIYSKGNYMYDLQSFQGSHKYNLITIRTIKGKFVGRVRVPTGSGKQLYELESLSCNERTGKWYICFYRANVKPSGDTHRKNYLYEIRNIW